MGNVYDIKTGEWRPDAHTLISTQELWFAVFMTVLYVLYFMINSYLTLRSVLIPWVTLREVSVDVEIVSYPSPPPGPSLPLITAFSQSCHNPL